MSGGIDVIEDVRFAKLFKVANHVFVFVANQEYFKDPGVNVEY